MCCFFFLICFYISTECVNDFKCDFRSFWFVAAGGILNFIGGIVSFKHPRQKVKRKRRRQGSYMGSLNGSGRNSAIATPRKEGSPRPSNKQD